MNRLIILFLFLTISTTAFGQAIDHYDFSMSGAYLPGGGGRSEGYSKNADIHNHTSSESYHYGKRYRLKQKKRKLKNDLRIETTINQLDSLFRLTTFTFIIDKSIIDSIKVHNNQNKYHKISNADIEKFFSHHDTITLRLKDIQPEDFQSTVIDGFPYRFNLTFVRPNQKSISYKFEGNFYDGVQTSNIKNWLPIYLAYRQHNFFETMPMEKYFTDKNSESVLLRFIEWTK